MRDRFWLGDIKVCLPTNSVAAHYHSLRSLLGERAALRSRSIAGY